MTNPNSGDPVSMTVPEVLEGSTPFAPEMARWDETTTSDELLRTARRLAAQLDRSADYGRELWHHLERIATYLREDIAHHSDDHGVLDGDAQRERWSGLYGSTLSLLAGARGDSGFGAEQARLEINHLDGTQHG